MVFSGLPGSERKAVVEYETLQVNIFIKKVLE